MNKGELEGLWKQAGGRAGAADIASAVALAESGGNPSAEHHNTNGSIDRGLWQINSVHGPLSTLNPLANARSAVIISVDGADWSPWVTYQTGAYRQYLGSSGGVTGVRNVDLLHEIWPGAPIPDLEPGNPIKPAEEGIHEAEQGINAAGSVASFFVKLTKLLFSKDGWVRMGKVLVGLFLLLTGVLGMAKIEAGPQVKKALDVAAAVK